jgi:hypothetical protein
VNLVFLGVQQDRAAMAAGVVYRIIARNEHGRGIQNDADSRRVNYFEADLRS